MEIKTLIEFLEKYKDKLNGEVFYQRIEDKYFETHGWTTTSVQCPGEDFPSDYIAINGIFIKDGNLYIDAHY